MGDELAIKEITGEKRKGNGGFLDDKWFSPRSLTLGRPIQPSFFLHISEATAVVQAAYIYPQTKTIQTCCCF